MPVKRVGADTGARDVARREVDGNRAGGIGEVERVEARSALDDVVASAAGEDVVARATIEGVVAGAAVQDVGAVIADQRVVALAADDVLDVDERVGAGFIAESLAGREIDGDTGRVAEAGEIGNGIDAVAAVEHVVVDAADQDVVAIAAGEGVVLGAAIEHVVARAAVDGVVAPRHHTRCHRRRRR